MFITTSTLCKAECVHLSIIYIQSKKTAEFVCTEILMRRQLKKSTHRDPSIATLFLKMILLEAGRHYVHPYSMIS